jgi:general secretion pathway protein C
MNGRLKNWLEGGALYFLLDLVLIAALAVSLAHWTWIFAAPKPLAAPAARAQVDSGITGHTAARHLFGVAQGSVAPLAPASAKLRLVGVASPAERAGGRAIFTLENGKSMTAGAGEAILPGLILKEIHPDHVLVERDGLMERFELQRRAASLDLEPRARRNGGR